MRVFIGLMCVPFIAAMSSCMAGCDRDSAGDSSAASTQPVQSQVLRTEFDAALTSALVGKTDAAVPRLRREADAVASKALLVTSAEEKRFRAGQFDDDGNQK